MFDGFRVNVKEELKKRQWNYAKLCEQAHISENTIKYFMCGASDSRRVAEKIADALGCGLKYREGFYDLEINTNAT